MATASLVLGIIGFVLAIIPFANYAAYPLVVLAIVFGLLAFAWGKAKAGVILGVLGLIATVGWSVAIAGAFDDAVNKPHTVVYRVTGTGRANIDYFNFNGDGSSGKEHTDSSALPFAITVKGKGDISSYTVSAQAEGSATMISCSIEVDGKIKAQQSSTGQYALVICSADGS